MLPYPSELAGVYLSLLTTQPFSADDLHDFLWHIYFSTPQTTTYAFSYYPKCSAGLEPTIQLFRPILGEAESEFAMFFGLGKFVVE
jgi:hypothetical protein